MRRNGAGLARDSLGGSIATGTEVATWSRTPPCHSKRRNCKRLKLLEGRCGLIRLLHEFAARGLSGLNRLNRKADGELVVHERKEGRQFSILILTGQSQVFPGRESVAKVGLNPVSRLGREADSGDLMKSFKERLIDRGNPHSVGAGDGKDV